MEFMLLVIHKQDGMIVSCAADVLIEWELCRVIASSGISMEFGHAVERCVDGGDG